MVIAPGDTLIVELAGGQPRVKFLPTAIREVQDLVRTFNPNHRPMVDELISERKVESRDE